MQRRRSRLKVLLVAAVYLVGAAALVGLLSMRVLARTQLERVLERMGVDRWRFTLPAADMRGLHVRGLELGQSSWLTAPNLAVSYDLASLLRGRVHAVELSDAVWTIRLREGKLDMGLHFKRSDPARPLVLPFDELRFHDSRFILEWQDQQVVIPFQGTVRQAGTSRVTMTGELLLEPSMLRVDSAGLSAVGLGGRVGVECEFTRSGMSIRALQPGTITWERLEVGSTDRPLSLAQGGLEFSQPEEYPLVQFAFNEANRELQVRAGIESSGALSMSAGAVSADIGRVSASAEFSSASGRAPRSLLELWMQNVLIKLGAPALEGEVGRMAAAPPGGALQAVKVIVRGEGGILTASAMPQLDGQTQAVADGRLELQPTLRGQLNARTDWLNLDNAAWLASTAPQLETVQLKGRIKADAALRLDGDGLKPFIQVAFEDVGASSPDWSGSLQSATGQLAVKSLDPLITDGSQTILIDHARAGDLEISDGVLEFSAASIHSIHVQRADWSMGEFGRFSAAPFEFDPQAARFSTQVNCTDAGLGPWLELLTDGRATGEGRLQGQLSLTIAPHTSRPVELGAGTVEAVPAHGWIQAHDAPALSELLDRSDQRFASDQRLNEVKHRLLEALSDFEYSTLRMDFLPRQDELLLQLQVRGRGRQGIDPQEIGGLTINVHDFNTWLLVKTAIGRVRGWNDRSGERDTGSNP